MPRSSRRIGAQRGAALLAFVLVLIVGSATLLLSRLDAHAYAGTRAVASQKTLLEAKRALLRYAMMYPDLSGNSSLGPGYLPCPDFDGDGVADDCGNSSTEVIQLGRLPFQTLATGPLQDSVGEYLWYAVSDNFKETLGAAATLNSDGPEGLIKVDGADDIVAVVLAPGDALNFQDGRPGNDAEEYLEQPDAMDKGEFRTTGDQFNDRLVTITRSELVAAMEQYALMVLTEGLKDYRSNYGAYPWLSPFDDEDFDAEEGTTTGRIPFHEKNEPFETEIGVDWNISGARVTVNTSLTNVAHQTGIAASIVTSAGTMSDGNTTAAKATCIWSSEDTVNCSIDDDLYLTGLVSVAAVPNSESRLDLVDTEKDFTNAGIKRGDLVVNYSVLSGELASGTGEEGDDTVTLTEQEDGNLLLTDVTTDFTERGVVARTSLAVVSTGAGTARFIAQEVVSDHELSLLPLPDEALEPDADFDYVVYKASRAIVDATTTTASRIQLRAIDGDSSFRLNVGDRYRILASSRRYDERADNGTDISKFIVYERTSNTSFCADGVEVGDAVENRTYGGIGIITALNCNGRPYWFTYTALKGGAYPDIYQSEDYRIHHTAVHRRSYDIDFAGNVVVPNTTFTDWTEENEGKKRSVCLGYGDPTLADENFCEGSAVPVSMAPTSGTSLVVIKDTHIEGSTEEIVGYATLADDGSTTGSIRVLDMEYYLVFDDPDFNLEKSEAELPAWFVESEWYKPIYVAYSGGLAPGVTDDQPCNASDPDTCLAVQIVRPAGDEEITDLEALVAVAPGTALDDQVRSTDATFSQYFEAPHAEGNLAFRKAPASSAFNDQVRVLKD